VRVGIHAPWISHLLFANDCIIFSVASRRGADRLQEILGIYSRGSGQLVNKDKYAIFFSANCAKDAKQEVRSVLRINTEALVEKYLGLPTALDQVTNGAFESP
jgi:hypothetical protein